MADAMQISRIPTETILVPVVGTSPLLMNRFSEKAKRQMLDAMQGKKTPKEPKNPASEYEGAFYRLLDGQPGIPAVAFKQATVGAARYFGKDVPMTMLRQVLFFHGEVGQHGDVLIPIEGEPQMREDVVRVGRGGADLRYRPEFLQWSAVLPITYVTSMLTNDSVLSLVDAGGMGVGVGEWRIEKNGVHGTYQINSEREVTVYTGDLDFHTWQKEQRKREEVMA